MVMPELSVDQIKNDLGLDDFTSDSGCLLLTGSQKNLSDWNRVSKTIRNESAGQGRVDCSNSDDALIVFTRLQRLAASRVRIT